MPATSIGARGTTTIVAATSAAGSVPTNATDGYTNESDGGLVTTYLDYTGAVTAAVVRLYVREAGGTEWRRGASTSDLSPLAPATGDEARDWEIGEGREFTFVLESITQTGGGTVSLRAAGVNR